MPVVAASWWQGRAWVGRALALTLACAGMTTACSGVQPPSGAQTPSSAGASTPGGSPTSATATPPSATTQTPTPTQTTPLLELPRGGRQIFPAYRLVGFSGAPNSPALGRLGIGDLDDRVKEIEKVGAAYAKGRTVLPVLELITTVVDGYPGRDGLYRHRQSPEVIRTYLEAARRHKALLLLNIQPGRAHFMDEVKAYEPWLREPDVGVALDPEWAVGPGQVPGRVFGRTTGAELDAVAAYLSALVAQEGLPEKVMVYHQLHTSIVRTPSALRAHPGVAMVASVDGIGSPGAKTATWKKVIGVTPKVVHPGFKLFYVEDRQHGPLMTPAQVLALKPTPEYVLYE